MMKKVGLILLTAIAVFSCKPENKEVTLEGSATSVEASTPAEEFVTPLETAHHKQDYLQQQMVSFELDLNFGGKDRLDATLYLSTDSNYIRVEKADGSLIIYDGEKVWGTPAAAITDGARFDVFTWSYFFSLPYKLSDPGTRIALKENSEAVLRLNFKEGTGDAPDDWYDLYTAPKTDLLNYAGYIVTYGGTAADQAAQNAHAIGYEDYQEVDGIPIAHIWKFYNYKDRVDTTAVIGNARLSSIKFGPLDKSLFSKPDNAIEITL